MNEINTISILGSGNVATQLAKGLKLEGARISHIYSRNQITGKELALQVNAEFAEEISQLPKEQLILICTPDDQISSVLSDIPLETPVAYTSGSVELSSLTQRSHLGVFYPLQTFTKGREINLFEIPFFIEATNTDFAQQLFNLAWKVSRKVYFADSQKRSELHLAAVWINNFTNHLVYISDKYLQEKQLSIEFLQPLLKETIQKLDQISAYEAQTGPARRGDLTIVKKHLEKLHGAEREIYRLLSENIIKTYSIDDKL